MKGKVLVLGSDVKSFLSTVRSLGRHGLEVHTAWCSPLSPALKSKYIVRTHTLPLPGAGKSDWLAPFHTLLDKECFDLVIPTDDPTLIPLQLNRNLLSTKSRIYLLDNNVFKTAFDKIAVYRLALDLNIPVAKGAIVTSELEIHKLSALSFPLVLRPQSSYASNNIFDRINACKVYDQDELATALPIFLRQGDCLAQENFSGVGMGIEFIAKDGSLLCAFQHQRLHETITGGPSTYRKSVELNKEMLAASKKLIAALGYTGVGMVEFKYSLLTKQWVLIEINGRFWGSLPLTIAAGIDMPVYLYQLLVQGITSFPERYEPETYCRNLTADMDWFRHNLFADKKDPSLQTVTLAQVFSELVNVFSGREHNDLLVRDDLAPFFADCTTWFKDKLHALRLLLLKTYFSRPLIRELEVHKIKQKLFRTQSILFVCHGNITRSPFAEHYARRIFSSQLNFSSRGTSDISNRVPAKLTQSIAQKLNVDLSNHLSLSISAADMQNNDLIFVFDMENYLTLRLAYPAAKEKIFLLGILAAESNISDPHNKNLAVYEKTYRLIISAINRLEALSEQKPLIAQLIDTPGIGGAETVTIELSLVLLRENIATTVICPAGSEVEKKLKQHHCPVLSFPDYSLYKSTLTLPVFIWKFRRFLLAHNISLIHAHLTGPIIAAGLSAPLAGIPCVGTLHDTFIAKQNYLNLFLLRLVAFLGTKLVTVSRHMQQFYSYLRGFPNKAINLIPNAVCPPTIDYRLCEKLKKELFITEQTFIFISVGRLVRLKRYDLLLESYAKIATTNTRLLLVGDGEERPSLENLAQSLQITDTLHFLGQRNDINELLSLAHCFVLCSEIEGLSRSILEAMAIGLPVIATDVGGNKELVQHCQNGLLVPTLNAQAISEAMTILISDPSKQQAYGQAGKTLAQTQFSLPQMTQSYRKLYDSLIK
ncbi:MAG: ATP-grasp domain-containing protein [Deltaproteobacteria bacterium]|nr:ATP-grasp domain-containing protein [Deltaproteobacteria bacterium]